MYAFLQKKLFYILNTLSMLRLARSPILEHIECDLDVKVLIDLCVNSVVCVVASGRRVDISSVHLILDMYTLQNIRIFTQVFKLFFNRLKKFNDLNQSFNRSYFGNIQWFFLTFSQISEYLLYFNFFNWLKNSLISE